MPFGFRFALALLIGSAAAVVAAAPAKPHHVAETKTKKSAKRPAKKKHARTKSAKKKLAKKRKSARKPRRHARKHVVPRREHARPAIVQKLSSAPPPAPANAYSVSPEDANLPMPKTEAIPLRVPDAPEEEKSVRLDMTKPYGAATPAPSSGPQRGLASESPSIPTPLPSP